MKPPCCPQMDFARLTEQWSSLADPGSAEGVEFTVGRCTNCQQLLMSFWVAGGMAHGCAIVDQDFVEKLAAEADYPARKRLLADWWNSAT